MACIVRMRTMTIVDNFVVSWQVCVPYFGMFMSNCCKSSSDKFLGSDGHSWHYLESSSTQENVLQALKPKE